MSKASKYLISIVIVALIAIYLAGSIYAKRESSILVNNLVNTIEANYGNVVKQVTYQSVDANFFDLFDDGLTINGVTILFAHQTDNPLHIGQVVITHYSQNAQNIPHTFTIRLKQIQFTSFKQALINYSKGVGLSAYLAFLPSDFNPILNFSAVYDGSKQSLNLRYSTLIDDQTVLKRQEQLQGFYIDQPVNQLADGLLNALSKATIKTGQGTLQYSLNLDSNSLASSHGYIADTLNGLGYKNTALSIQGKADYDASTGLTQQQLTLELTNGGTIQEQSTVISPQAQNYQFLVNLFRGEPTANVKQDALLKSFSIEYKDHSFLNRVLSLMASNTGNELNSIKQQILSNLTKIALKSHIPALKSATQQLEQFIDQPGQITLSLNPEKPYSFNAINKFLTNREQAQITLQSQLQSAGPEQGEALYRAYQQRQDANMDKFLKNLGFSVVTTPLKVSN